MMVDVSLKLANFLIKIKANMFQFCHSSCFERTIGFSFFCNIFSHNQSQKIIF